MSQVIVEFDNTLKQSEIVMPLVSSSPQEAGNNYTKNQSGVQQTHVFGIQVPIIAINNIVIDFTDIIEFTLKSTDVLPSVSMIVRDKYGLIGAIDMPDVDNELRVQILPQFENAYKKINLTFFINKIRINNDYLTINGIYKLSSFTSANFKSFGELNSYNLFSNIAKETGLGFATNVKSNDQDKRYVYCNYKSYKDLLDREISFGGNQIEIYDYWIDFWNNLTLVDIYDRYNHIDNDEDMEIWISGQIDEVGEGVEIKPFKTVALINNHPNSSNTELFVKQYEIINNPGLHTSDGSDHVYSIYEMEKQEYMDHLVQDGDVKKDIFTKYDYLGEAYGEYNYLLQECFRKSFLQKMKSETLEVTIKRPSIGLMRGSKVNFISYINDSMIEDKFDIMDKTDYMNSNPETTMSFNETYTQGENLDNGKFSIDRMISGQYLITGCKIQYYNNNWSYVLTLNRPANQKPIFIENE